MRRTALLQLQEVDFEAELVWFPERGMGYYPVAQSDEPYLNGGAQSYWDKYVAYSKTELGAKITAARVELVREWCSGPVIDVGIGCGSFVEAMHAAGIATYGFDVNPVATEWLRGRGLWRDPFADETAVDAVSLWDVLEHLPDPEALIRRVRSYVFTSLPVFSCAEDVLTSKHFRRDEHRWYWTPNGLIDWMHRLGFECLEDDYRETALGRESIGTYAFRRRS